MHPWKFTAHVMRDNIAKGANLQTHTLVARVSKSFRNPAKWDVETDRGVIECSQVVHATNGYIGAVEPSLRGIIRPQPHICNRLTPPPAFSGESKLQNSYGVFSKGMYSINPRTSSDGYVLFGGVNPGIPGLDAWLNKNPHRCIDDGLTEFESVTKAVRDLTENELIGWTEDGKPDTSELYSWSGILGLVSDLLYSKKLLLMMVRVPTEYRLWASCLTSLANSSAPVTTDRKSCVHPSVYGLFG